MYSQQILFRRATINDLPQLKAVYREIIDHMNKYNIQIWDDVYPCEFFAEDIVNRRLYVLEENDEILSAFSLSASNEGGTHVKWESNCGKALYIDRFGVNIRHRRKGIGRMALRKAAHLAKMKGADYLRLFVVDINTPAIKLYQKSGFKQAAGIYHQIIDDDLTLQEFGFEIGL